MFRPLGGTCCRTFLCLVFFSSVFAAECSGWKIEFDGIDGRPVVMDGVLYVGSQDRAVYAFDSATGGKKWRFQTGDAPSGEEKGSRIVRMTLVVRNGVVFIAAQDFTFYALDAATGEKKWSYDAGSRIYRSAVPDDGTAYVITEKGLHAIDASTGREKWLFEALYEIPRDQILYFGGGRPPASGLVQGEQAVYLSAEIRMKDESRKSFVYAVDSESGTAKWVATFGGWDTTALLVAKGLVFVAAEDSFSAKHAALYAFNAVDGQLRWKLGADELYANRRILIRDNVIYFQTDRALIAAEMESGRQIWSISATNIQGDLAVDNQHVYYVTEKGSTLHALELTTGHEKWSRGLGGGAYLDAVHESVVYAGQKHLYAIDAATGAQLWSFSKVGSGYSALIAEGRIFATSQTVTYFGTDRKDQGYLCSLDARTGKP